MKVPIFVRHSNEVADAHIASGFWNSDSMWGWVDKWAQSTPDKIAVQEASGYSHTYKELSLATRRFANALLGIGLRKGDVVAIQLSSCTEFLVAYFGVIRMGGVLVTLHMPFREGELGPLLRASEAKAIICGPSTAKYEGPVMMQRLQAEIPRLRHIILARGKSKSVDGLEMAGMIEASSEASVADQPAASDPALMCFTSGTSAAPKAVVHACETLAANARVYSETIKLNADDRSLIAPPFTHIFGLECTNNAVYTGGTVLPLDRFTASHYAEMLEKLRPTVLYSAPAHLAATLKSNELDGRDLDSVRTVILGGSICPPHIAWEFESHLPNGKVGILFGMTETLLVTQTPIDGEPKVRHGTVGSPVPGIKARIVDPEGNAVEDGQEGELQLNGFSIMAGYTRNDSANAKAFTPDGWFCTQDLAMWDGRGNIIISGRLTDIINRGGIKINPTDIENAISKHENVLLAALIPMPDDILGERICAVVTLEHSTSLPLEELCRFLASRGIAKLLWPERIIVLDEMPMTPTKKISKGQLRRQLQEFFITAS